ISMTQNAAPKPLSAELTKDNGIIQNGTAQPTPPAAEPQPPMVPPVAEAPAPAPVTAQAVAQEPAPVNPASIPVTNAQPVSTAPAPAAQPVVAQPVVPAPVPSTTAVVAPAAVPAPAPVTAPATAKNAATDDARVAELTARVDELQKSLAQATQQLSQMGNKVATPAASGDVNDRIAHLEQEIIQLQQAPATVKARPIVQAAAEAPVVTSHKKHHSKTPGTTSHHKTTQKSTREANTSGRWVLRAASPDEAWVSKTADSHDLRPVHVGDTVPGIGRVQSIDQVGDNWVVRGTAGAIH
ncbi:MAG: hypothetical protein JO253_06875, partial [Alphaproteobacteria bacterium]|nr:hypothetical protein [Alphaproteobacteria bacterium]